MIVKSRGIVLSTIKYGDTSIISRIFTEERGYDSFIVNAIRSQKSKKSIAYFQPFSILDLVMYVKESRELQRISEFKYAVPIHNLHQDLTKSSITLFLTEVFSKLLQFEQSPHLELYHFVQDSIIKLNDITEGVANFHLQFLLKIGPYLGFEIEHGEHLYSSIDKLAPSKEEYQLLDRMMKEPFGSIFDINRTTRGHLLDTILNFYKHHAHISTPKSLAVLRSILN